MSYDMVMSSVINESFFFLLSNLDNLYFFFLPTVLYETSKDAKWNG